MDKLQQSEKYGRSTFNNSVAYANNSSSRKEEETASIDVSAPSSRSLSWTHFMWVHHRVC